MDCICNDLITAIICADYMNLPTMILIDRRYYAVAKAAYNIWYHTPISILYNDMQTVRFDPVTVSTLGVDNILIHTDTICIHILITRKKGRKLYKIHAMGAGDVLYSLRCARLLFRAHTNTFDRIARKFRQLLARPNYRPRKVMSCERVIYENYLVYNKAEYQNTCGYCMNVWAGNDHDCTRSLRTGHIKADRLMTMHVFTAQC